MSIEDELNGSNPWANDDMYSSLTIKELGEFQEWFFENCVCFDAHINYDPLIKLCDPLLGSGCYGNGQFLSLTEGLEYAEGVVDPDSTYTGDHIAHAFNVIGGKVADFSFKKITKESPQYLSAMPGKYYGIIIPNDFIKKMQEGNETPYELHKPLLIDYWREQTKGS